MPSGSGRRLAAAVVPVFAVALAWASLEHAARPLPFVAVSATTLLAALPARLRARLAVAGVAFGAIAVAVVNVSPATLRDVADRGAREAWAVAPPFAPASHPELHVLVVLVVAAFALGIAVVAGSRPFVAAALTIAGVGWAATILPARNTIAMGALALFATLWPVAVGGARDRRGLVPGAVTLVVLVAVAAGAADAGARLSFAGLDWKSWDLFGDARAGRTVAIVWSSNYEGIDFPAKKTTVLRVEAPDRALYWRATTLDGFLGDRWMEFLYLTGTSSADGPLPRDRLLPTGADTRAGWVKQGVDVLALVDDHVIAAGQPMEIAGGSANRIRSFSSGVMLVVGDLRQMLHYTVWSYAPAPTPAALVRSPAAYPDSLTRFRDVGRTVVPPFGSPGREAAVTSIFTNELYQPLWPYAGMWQEARRLTAESKTPYEATIRIERWLRSDGGFGYDEHPPSAVGAPPLVDFVERTKLGYCQHFAGTMALMLRYLGIPARVAVGFTSGTWKDGRWTVTDHDAHAWVEAWFAGYGWLTFDPTPGRGTLSASYTNASDSADALRALRSGRFLPSGRRADAPGRRGAVPQQASGRDIHRWPVAAIAVLAAALVALALVKRVHRYRRAATRDPRGRASAARAELAAFIRDQGAPVAGTASIGDLVVELRGFGVGCDGFAAAFTRARYGPPAGARAAADDARRELRRVISVLRGRLGPGRRLRGFLALRSLRES